MNNLGTAGVAAALAVFALASQAAAPDRPTARHLEWADCEIGVIIHHDLQVYAPSFTRHDDTNVPPASVFNPSALDTDQWLETAKAAGAKYAVFVAKHCSGFSLWPTKAHAYSVASSPWKGGKGDLVADFLASCRAFGIRPGLYASTGRNCLYGICGDIGRKPESVWRPYAAMVQQQLTELWTNYGELFEIWFDGGNLPRERGGLAIEDLLVKLQPNAVVFQGNPARMPCVRWVGNEAGRAPDPCWSRTRAGTDSDGMKERNGLIFRGEPEGAFWCPGEADTPNRDRQKGAFQGGWFWREGQDGLVYPAEALLDRYFTSVGRGCNMLIGMVIDNRGRVPDADVREFVRFGQLVRKLYENPLASTNGTARVFELTVPAGKRPDLLSVAEDLRAGEKVRAFALSGFDGTAWRPLAKGEHVGHRRLVRFAADGCTRFRLELTAPAGVTPVIRDLTLYDAP